MIRNGLYTKYLHSISSLATDLSEAMDNLPTCSSNETLEETQIRYSIQLAAEALNNAKRIIKHFSKDTKEGILEENSYGKFTIMYKKGGESYQLSCGSSIEVYLSENIEKDIEEGWYSGRVEHNKQYYFHGPNKIYLFNGMRVRQRVDSQS